jgi:ribonuclease HI
MRIKTDHVPIVTTLNLYITRTPPRSYANFREVDWDKFREDLKTQLSEAPPPEPITSHQSLYEECDKLTKALQETISNTVPTTEIGPHSRRWWTKELSQLRKAANKAGRKASKAKGNPRDPAHKEFEEARKKYVKEIDYCKKHHWRDWLEKAEEPDIWTANKYISAATADGTLSRIPTLVKTSEGNTITAATNEEKSKMLAKTFFPTQPLRQHPPPEVQEDPNDTEQVCEMDPVTKDQIRRHIARLKPFKAPGPDGIPNIALIKSADIIIDRLHRIYKAMVDQDLFYDPWKQFTTVVLRKPGKPKYNVPKAYRPIALLNTMVKVLTAVLAEQMMYYAEHHNLLPANHFGGRKRRNATDAVHLLVNDIKNAWRKGNVVAVLFLDIEGAFPNADNAQLTRNLTRRGIPKKLVNFVARMLKDRSTTLKFDDYVSNPITLNNGIGQGDPLSMALYQFYNADLLDIPTGRDESAIAYVDDAILIAKAKTFAQAHEKLKDMMTRKDGAIEWTKTHNSQFEYSKLALLDFAHQSKKVTRPPLSLPSITISPTRSAKYLGVMLDQNLTWKEQLAYVVGKGTNWASQINRAARPSWGLTPKAAKRLYQGVAIPRILYGIDIWCVPSKKSRQEGAAPGPEAAIAKIASSQRAGTIAITGGFRTSPSDSLDAHASILPTRHRLGKAQHSAAVRLAALPASHPLHNQFRLAASRKVKRHRAPLHHLASTLEVSPKQIECTPVTRTNPASRQDDQVNVFLPDNKEASKQLEARSKEVIKVYADGSSHNGNVGAAAVLYRAGRPKRTLRMKLGPDNQHTVYEAELVGMLMGLYLIKTERKCRVKCVLGVDNQAAIQALNSELTNPGQYIAAECLKLVDQINQSKRSRKFKLTVRWMAGHSGIKGNEKADKEAKRAAEGHVSDKADLPPFLRKPLKVSTSATKQRYNEKTVKLWKEEWHTSDRFKRFKAPDISTPSSSKFLKLISKCRISRPMASLIYQLRVGHAPLNGYLHRFKKVDSPRCPACGEERETAEHFIKRCPSYAHERWALTRHYRFSDPTMEDILSNPETIVPLVNYIEATGRFKDP